MKVQRTLLLAVVSVVVVLVALETAGLSWIDWLRFPDRMRAFSSIEAKYAQILENIDHITQVDSLIEQKDVDPLHLVRGHLYTGCIRASLSRTYGTNRSFLNVQKDFGKIFSQMGWTVQGYGYSTKTATIFLTELSSLPLNNNGKNYLTVYQLVLEYADPATEACYG